MISRTAKERRHGPTEVPFKESISVERRERELSIGQTEVTMKGSSRIIKLMEKAFISGVMVKPLKEAGATTSYTEKEFSLLKMAEYT